jgi:hypothetical protein
LAPDPFDRDNRIDTLLTELAGLGPLAGESSWPDDPLARNMADIARFVADATRLEQVSGRDFAIGCEIDEKSLPKAQAIASANIGELVAAPEYATLLDRPGGENRIFALLVQSCAAEIGAKIKLAAGKRRRPRAWRSDPLRRKAELRKVSRGTPLRLATQDGLTLL